jgi:hypothetical protein
MRDRRRIAEKILKAHELSLVYSMLGGERGADSAPSATITA